MELPVCHQGEIVGSCQVSELGLYWNFVCRCRLLSDRIERLYWKEHRLGVLERESDSLVLRRRIAKKLLPGFPGEGQLLYLRPPVQVLDCLLPPTLEKDGKLWYLCGPERPFPCMPLACFFTLEQEGEQDYWVISRDLACSTL